MIRLCYQMRKDIDEGEKINYIHGIDDGDGLDRQRPDYR